MSTPLDEQIVLVTGAGRGFGTAITRAFAREGARVAINYFRSRAGDAFHRVFGQAIPNRRPRRLEHDPGNQPRHGGRRIRPDHPHRNEPRSESGCSLTDYTAAKTALLALTRTSAVELGPKGITVNMVSGGLLRTTDASAATPEASSSWE